jgi:hypothetical protein
VEEILKQYPARDVRVFAVWEPMLATDWMRPTTFVLARLRDRRGAQYWDPEHLLAKRMASDARDPQPKQKCCTRNGVLWDMAAVYPPGAVWGDAMPSAVFFNGPVANVEEELEAQLKR